MFKKTVITATIFIAAIALITVTAAAAPMTGGYIKERRYIVTKERITPYNPGGGSSVTPTPKPTQAPHVHKYSSWHTIVEATCTMNGTQECYCSCGETQTQSIPSLGHNWGEWHVTNPATCTADGEQARECSRCYETETEQLPATGHTWSEWEMTQMETCTTDGTWARYCSCGVVEEENVPKTGHDWAPYETVEEATIFKDGLKRSMCENCGETRDKTIDKLTLAQLRRHPGEPIGIGMIITVSALTLLGVGLLSTGIVFAVKNKKS